MQQVKPPEPAEDSEPDDAVFGEWDSWENVPSSQPQPALSVQNKAQHNSVQHNSFPSRQAAPEPEPEPEPDYFSDLGLAPTTKKQKKVSPIWISTPIVILPCISISSKLCWIYAGNQK